LALNAGYRHIDCASRYGNQKEIGDVLQRYLSNGLIKREELFITSKVWNSEWGSIREACLETLSALKVDYLDLYLVHTPISWADDLVVGNVPLHRMWPQMEELVSDGLVKEIGISNFPVVLIHDLLTYAKIRPSVHQIEIHPYFQQVKNVEYSQSQGLKIVTYSPLANAQKDGPLFDPIVGKIATAHRVSLAQVLIRWALQKGYSVITKSMNIDHVVEDFNVLDFSLSVSEMQEIDNLERGMRTNDLASRWSWPLYS